MTMAAVMIAAATAAIAARRPRERRHAGRRVTTGRACGPAGAGGSEGDWRSPVSFSAGGWNWGIGWTRVSGSRKGWRPGIG